MQIKWDIINPLKCNHVTGTIAKSKCGHYEITYHHKEQRFRLWFHSILGYTLPLCSTSYHQFPDFNDHLIWFHQFIERRSIQKVTDKLDKTDDHTCGNCSHLIFKDFEHHEGTCSVTRLHRNFESPCALEEDK